LRVRQQRYNEVQLRIYELLLEQKALNHMDL
jgi:hypothetical protein